MFVFALVCSFTANAAHTVTINIDDVSRVGVKVYNQSSYEYEDQTVQNGDNQFTLEDYQYCYIIAKEGNVLTSVTRTKAGESEATPLNIRYSSSSYNAGPGWQTYFYGSSYDSYDGYTITVISDTEEHAYSGTCTVKVDDASKVVLTEGGTYNTIELTSGQDNTVKFIPGVTSSFRLQVNGQNYSGDIYQVTVNGTAISPSYGSYTIDVKTNDVIDIQANFPDKNCTVNISFEDADAAKGFITEVKNGETVISEENYGSFTVKLGTQVTIYANTSDYKVDKFTINGTPVSTYSYADWSTSFTVTEETNTIAIDAHRYGELSFTLNLNDIQNVKVYKGFRSEEDRITGLVVGDNALTISETNAKIFVVMENADYLLDITDGTNTYTSGQAIMITEGMTITVTTTLIERNNAFALYIDDISLADYQFMVERNSDPDRNWMTNQTLDGFTSGYNTVRFMDNELYFTINYYSSHSDLARKLYINGVETAIKQDNGNGANWEFTVANNDVVKLYFAAEPSLHTVHFNVATGYNVTDLVSDRLVERSADTDFSVLTGTEVTFSTTGVVSVDGELLTADEEGVYTVTVTGDVTINVAADIVSGMENVAVENDNNVYTLQGILLLQNATKEQINALPQGMYIINGETRFLLRK